jgi:hypothetical protein
MEGTDGSVSRLTIGQNTFIVEPPNVYSQILLRISEGRRSRGDCREFLLAHVVYQQLYDMLCAQ